MIRRTSLGKKFLNDEETEVVTDEFAIDVLDEVIITTGEHIGRISCYKEFTSKTGIKYGKITIGTLGKYEEKSIVHTLERVFFADYHLNSEIVNVFKVLGCMDGKKIYPERLLNKAVKFTIAENPEKTSRYRTVITEISPIDEIPTDEDFKFVKTFNGKGYDFVAVMPEDKEVKNAVRMGNGSAISMKQMLQDVSDGENFD